MKTAKEEKSEDPKEDEDDSKSIHSAFSISSKRDAKNNIDPKIKIEKTISDKNKGEIKSILSWPKGCFNQVVYVILYPFHLIYWVIMPNIYQKAEIIKV